MKNNKLKWKDYINGSNSGYSNSKFKLPVLNKNSFEELLDTLSNIIQKDQGLSSSLNKNNIFNITKLKSMSSCHESKYPQVKEIEGNVSASINGDLGKYVMNDESNRNLK